MRIDLPICSLKDCRYNFDCNCISKNRKETCEFDMYKKAFEEQAKDGVWIPCNVKMPEKDGRYICTMESGEVMECSYGWNNPHSKKMFFRRSSAVNVIAWRTMPEKYQQ